MTSLVVEFFLLTVTVTSPNISCAQVLPTRETVGNGSVIAPAAGAREPYGINNAPPTPEFLTRQFKRGQFSGIGESFLQTTSPTSESSPARAVPVRAPAISTSQFRLPKVESAFPEFRLSPALGENTTTFSKLKIESPAAPAPEAPSFVAPSQSTEYIPSFNKKPSISDQIEFKLKEK
jgi:hypothetical protein